VEEQLSLEIQVEVHQSTEVQGMVEAQQKVMEMERCERCNEEKIHNP
jgi:formylmethanofuran dehydrogenase subunit E